MNNYCERASKLPTTMVCPASLKLRGGAPVVDSPAAESGRKVHAALAAAIEREDISLVSTLSDDEKFLYYLCLQQFEELRARGLPNDRPQCEVATSRTFCDVTLTATVDFLLDCGDAAYIIDWKTGFSEPSESWWWQLYAAAAIGGPNNRDWTRVFIAFAMPRISTIYSRTVDRDEIARRLDAIVAGVRRAHECDTDDLSNYTVSPNCEFCPAVGRCPATARSLSLIAPSDDAPAPLTRERAGEVWTMLRALERRIEEIRAIIRGYAIAQPIQLGDGRMLAPVERAAYEINAGDAISVLESSFGINAETALDVLKLTKSDVEKIIRRAAPRGRGAAMTRSALERLESAGCVRKSIRMEIREISNKSLRGGDDDGPIDCQ